MNQYVLLTALSLALLPLLVAGQRWAFRPVRLDLDAVQWPIVESRYNWRLGAWLLALGAIFLFLSRFDVLPPFSRRSLVLLSAVVLPCGGWLVLDRRVKLRIDSIGIRYSRWGDVTLQWSELAGVEIRTFRGAPFIHVLPEPTAGLRTRLPLPWRLAGAVSRLGRADEFSISGAGLEHGVLQLYAAISSYRARRGSAA
jgi:hypothetical protein